MEVTWYQIVITNLNKPQFTKTTTTQTDGTYGEGFFDLTNQVADPGDVIQTVVKSKDGTTTLGSNTKTYSSGTSITIDVALVPQGTVTLDSGGPPTWTYTLTHISGIVKSWTYTGDGITGATVTGTAATAGWTVGTQTSNSVTFTNTTELTSPVSGFQISGTQGGTGTWTVGDSSGTIDGSLPVELASFTGTLAGNGVRIHWRTETETNNLGFNVYRSRTQEGDYIRITPTLIKGHGTDATPHDYSFLDETAEVGKTYYYYIQTFQAKRTNPISSRSGMQRRKENSQPHGGR
ncbi:hypothetical protein HYR99_21315 [Candidatus Poribacteria bacterium]|nr:hypothetical protein [Candidatus Poribacteria bacterium]